MASLFIQRQSSISQVHQFSNMDTDISIDSSLYLTHNNEQYCDYLDEDDSLNVGCEDDEQNVYEKLAEKEQYLLLAAEAGKALLERNGELEEKLNNIQEDYRAKMEELQQDKHYLRTQMSQREEHYEASIQDLQNEVQNLGLQLNGVQKVSQTFEKSQKENIKEILSQNETLGVQLQQMKSHNDQLSFQVSTLKKRIETNNTLATTPQSNVQEKLESAEIAMLRQKIRDLQGHTEFLEESILELENDKESLTQLYQKANDDNLVVVQKLTDSEQELIACQHELQELKSSNCEMKDQLDEHLLQASFNGAANNSLFNELKETSMSECDISLCTRLQGISPGTPMAQSSAYSLQTLKRPRPVSTEIIESDDGEYALSSGVVSMAMESYNSMSNPEHEKLLDELQEAYHKVIALCQELTSNGCYTQEEINSNKLATAEELFQSGNLLCAIDQLTKLLQNPSKIFALLRSSPTMTRSGQSSNGNDEGSDNGSIASDSQASHADTYEQQITELNSRLNEAMREWETSKKSNTMLLLESKEKDDDINKFSQKVTYLEKELESLQNERKLLLSDLSDDSKLKKAIQDRKEALSRENNLSLEKEQLEYDMMKLNDQLLEAVQQKYELSEQLEQWQFDMASMIEKQLASKMRGEPKRTVRKNPRSALFPGKWSWVIKPSTTPKNTTPKGTKAVTPVSGTPSSTPKTKSKRKSRDEVKR